MDKPNLVSPICVEIARFYTLKFCAVHTPNSIRAFDMPIHPINFCGEHMRPNAKQILFLVAKAKQKNAGPFLLFSVENAIF